MKAGRRIIALCVVLILGICLIPTTASHAESGGMVSISIEQVFTVFGTDATPNTEATYSLDALGGAPVPTDASSGDYEFKLDGNDSKTIEISFPHAGVFEYKLSCTGKGTKGYTYDTEKYKISAYVKNTENGGLEADILAENSDGNNRIQSLKRGFFVSSCINRERFKFCVNLKI